MRGGEVSNETVVLMRGAERESQAGKGTGRRDQDCAMGIEKGEDLAGKGRGEAKDNGSHLFNYKRFDLVSFGVTSPDDCDRT